MAARLFLIHGSHPCVTVELALQRKGVDYQVTELLPPLHPPVARVVFGARTVPAIIFDGGEKVSGSRPILRRLDELAPDPPLLPDDPAQRTAVLEAERWGDETFQQVARIILWPALGRRTDAVPSYQRGSRLPSLPDRVVRAMAPGIIAIEQRMNHTDWDHALRAVDELPAQLDRIDGWLADGVIGGEEPNAADLQLAPTVRLLMTLADLRPLIENRPLAAWARRVAPEPAGAVPPGVFSVPVAA